VLQQDKETHGYVSGKFDTSQLPSGARLVIPDNVTDTRGVETVRLEGGMLVVQQEKGFSGVITMAMVMVLDGVAHSMQVTLTVNPAAVQAQFAITAKNNVNSRTWLDSSRAESYATVSWQPSGNANGYQLWLLTSSNMSKLSLHATSVDRVLLCTTTNTSCEFSNLLGPNSRLELAAFGNDNTQSVSTLASYSDKGRTPVLRTMFGGDSAKLTKEAKRELRQLAAVMRREGFTEIFLEGHISSNRKTPTTFGKWLSRERSKNVGAFLSKELGYPITVITRSSVGTKPVLPNTSEKNRERNRRVEISLR
jgi:outer membrane protein OmpA-like peptidoglycan-associated protein